MSAYVALDGSGSTVAVLRCAAETTYHVVEVPGTVRNPDNVVEALGGYKTLTTSFAKPAARPLTLRFEHADPYSKFLAASTNKSLGVVLKFQTNKKTGQKRVCIAGVVRQAYKFNSLADYYLSPEDVLRSPMDIVSDLDSVRFVPNKGCELPHNKQEVGRMRIENPVWEAQDELPPSVFTRQTQPFDYKYTVNVFSALSRYFMLPSRPVSEEVSPFEPPPQASNEDADEIPTKLAIVPRGFGNMCNIVARINDPRLPTEADIKPTAGVANDAALLAEIRALFDKRPLWQRLSLFAQLSKHATVWQLKPLLANTCYLFSDGPWRGCLCRLGYDPRTDPEARIYQSIDFRDTYFRSVKYRTQKESHAKAARVEEGGDYQFLEAPTKTSVLYQLADIQEPRLQRLLEITKPQPAFDPVYGWFDKHTMARIRDILSVRATFLRQQEQS